MFDVFLDLGHLGFKVFKALRNFRDLGFGRA